MKYLAPIPKQFVDHNGLPLSDGKVHVYISGDTQYANVYQDADGEELMPNPARLDSNGAWLGFVTAGIPLDYVVEDKDGNVQFEYEKVVAGGGTANVAIEPTLTSGTKIAECWVDGELLELFAPSGGGGGVNYVNESYTSSDDNVDVSSSMISCTFKTNLNNFVGEVHVRFQNTGNAMSLTQYVNGASNGIISTLTIMSGLTHATMPVIVKNGLLKIQVTFSNPSTPSSVKFDLVGYNM